MRFVSILLAVILIVPSVLGNICSECLVDPSSCPIECVDNVDELMDISESDGECGDGLCTSDENIKSCAEDCEVLTGAVVKDTAKGLFLYGAVIAVLGIIVMVVLVWVSRKY